jgi:hypothetical protein
VDALLIRPRKMDSSTRAMAEAEKLVKHAASSLRFQDVRAALEKLQEAVAILLPYSQTK